MSESKTLFVFSGGRDFGDEGIVRGILTKLSCERVFVGDCATGVDAIIRQWCKENEPRVRWKEFKADWGKHEDCRCDDKTKLCRAAGPRRNETMVSAAVVKSNPKIFIAFPGGPGTADCTARAMKYGIPVLKVL